MKIACPPALVSNFFTPEKKTSISHSRLAVVIIIVVRKQTGFEMDSHQGRDGNWRKEAEKKKRREKGEMRLRDQIR